MYALSRKELIFQARKNAENMREAEKVELLLRVQQAAQKLNMTVHVTPQHIEGAATSALVSASVPASEELRNVNQTLWDLRHLRQETLSVDETLDPEDDEEMYADELESKLNVLLSRKMCLIKARVDNLSSIFSDAMMENGAAVTFTQSHHEKLSPMICGPSEVDIPVDMYMVRLAEMPWERIKLVQRSIIPVYRYVLALLDSEGGEASGQFVVQQIREKRAARLFSESAQLLRDTLVNDTGEAVGRLWHTERSKIKRVLPSGRKVRKGQIVLRKVPGASVPSPEER